LRHGHELKYGQWLALAPQAVEDVVVRLCLPVSSRMAIQKKVAAASFYPMVNKANYSRL
jgi:hypothetical protein